MTLAGSETRRSRWPFWPFREKVHSLGLLNKSYVRFLGHTLINDYVVAASARNRRLAKGHVLLVRGYALPVSLTKPSLTKFIMVQDVNATMSSFFRRGSRSTASASSAKHLVTEQHAPSHSPEHKQGGQSGESNFFIDHSPNTVRRLWTPPVHPTAVGSASEKTMVEHVADQFSKIPYVDVGCGNQNHLRLLSPHIGDYSPSDQTPSCHQSCHTVDMESGAGGSGSKAAPAPVVHRRKTFLAIAILACAWLMNDVVLAWVHERVPYHSDPLPDIWFSIFPEYQPAIKLTEALLIISLLFAVATMIFHRHRWLVTRRVFFISALCYFGRAFCITLTQVPVPSRLTYCAPRANDTSAALIFKRVAGTLSGLGMDTLTAPRELCGDLIYSGHTTILCLCYLTVSRYAPRSIRFLRYLSQAMALIGVIGILIARKHYTLDVVLAYYITTRIYWIYHTLADNKSAFFATKRSGAKTDVANVFWAPILRFMESDAPQHVLPIVNQFDLPFRSTCESISRLVKRLTAKQPRLPLAVFSTSYWLRWTNKGGDDESKGRGVKNAIFLSI